MSEDEPRKATVSTETEANPVPEYIPPRIRTYTSEEIKGLSIRVVKAAGDKCNRCWKYDTTVGDSSTYEGACSRCVSALETILPA